MYLQKYVIPITYSVIMALYFSEIFIKLNKYKRLKEKHEQFRTSTKRWIFIRHCII